MSNSVYVLNRVFDKLFYAQNLDNGCYGVAPKQIHDIFINLCESMPSYSDDGYPAVSIVNSHTERGSIGVSRYCCNGFASVNLTPD